MASDANNHYGLFCHLFREILPYSLIFRLVASLLSFTKLIISPASQSSTSAIRINTDRATS